MGFIMLGSEIIGFAILRTRLPPRKSGPFFDMESLKDPAYSCFVIGLSLAFMAYFVPFFYIEPFSLRVGASEDLSFYMLAIMNGAGTLGRLFPNFLADRYLSTFLSFTQQSNQRAVSAISMSLPLSLMFPA
jgi:predicted MFS family arabinose efflux permease